MGYREPRQILTAVLRLCGQPSAGPSEVLDQSKTRVRSPISPPPARKGGAFPADFNAGRTLGGRAFPRAVLLSSFILRAESGAGVRSCPQGDGGRNRAVVPSRSHSGTGPPPAPAWKGRGPRATEVLPLQEEAQDVREDPPVEVVVHLHRRVDARAHGDLLLGAARPSDDEREPGSRTEPA